MSLDSANVVAQIVVITLEIGALIFAGFKFFIKLNQRIDKLEEQYKPNGGSSMRDAINRIEIQLSKLEGKFEQHIDDDK